MSDDQIKQYTMCGALCRFLTDRTADIDAVPAAHDEAADVQRAHAQTEKATANPIVQTKDVTLAANAAAAQLRKALPALLGPLSAVATKATDIDLLAKTTLRVSQLRRLTDAQLHELAEQLLSIGEQQPAATLTRYGLTTVLPKLREYQKALSPLVGQTQDLIDTRSSHNQSVEELLKATLQQIYELDKVMKIFQLLNPTLYRDYRKARFIGRRSGK